MARYQYVGPGPIEVLSGGEIVRPGDVREFDAEPTWGPWEPLDEPEETPAEDAGVVGSPPPPSLGGPAVLPLTPPPAKEF